MAYKLIIHSQAKKEIAEAIDFYKRINPNLALSFFNLVDAHLERIKENPFLFQIKYKNYREAFLKKYPFIIIYEVSENSIYVDSVFHTSRNHTSKP